MEHEKPKASEEQPEDILSSFFRIKYNNKIWRKRKFLSRTVKNTGRVPSSTFTTTEPFIIKFPSLCISDSPLILGCSWGLSRFFRNIAFHSLELPLLFFCYLERKNGFCGEMEAKELQIHSSLPSLEHILKLSWDRRKKNMFRNKNHIKCEEGKKSRLIL